MTARPADPTGAEAKGQLRERIARQRRGVAPEAAAAAADAVARIAAAHASLSGAPRIALYAAHDGELPTRALFEALASLGTERLLPRVREGVLEWAMTDDWAALQEGRFGILEPVGPRVDAPGSGEVVFVPGLAFDFAGWRLGRGGGFYDRAFPPGRPGPLLVGVAFAFQCVSAVPHDSRDRRVDAIVTEREWLDCPEDR